MDGERFGDGSKIGYDKIQDVDINDNADVDDGMGMMMMMTTTMMKWECPV